MSVYVDDHRADYRGMKMCHMIADTTDELVQMAHNIGLKPSYIQKRGTPEEHFDVCWSTRASAIKFGAIEVTPKELVAKIHARKIEVKP